MAWYYYSGKTARPIPVKRGLSKSVRPHSKVEILEETIEVKALIRKGQLRKTGKPKNMSLVSDEPIPDKTIKEVIGKSPLARFFAEKGITKSSNMPPVSKVGMEMTEHELNVTGDDYSPKKEKKDDGKSVEIVEEIDDAGVLNDDSNKKGKRTRR
jgi:hypothetical protein